MPAARKTSFFTFAVVRSARRLTKYTNDKSYDIFPAI